MGGIDPHGEILGPIYASGFGVADIGDVVYVTFAKLSERLDAKWEGCCVATL